MKIWKLLILILYVQKLELFWAKYNLKIRRPSHIGQPLPENASELIYTFLYKTIKERRYLCIGDDEIRRIINCYETSLYLENPTIKIIDI